MSDFFLFSRIGAVSLLCDLFWHLFPGGSKQDIFQLDLHRKLIRAPDSRTGLQELLGLGQFPILKVVLPKQHLHEPRGIPERDYNRSCGKSNSPAPLTATPKRENRKIQHEKEILKANKHAPV
jgi:hypothetical protein